MSRRLFTPEQDQHLAAEYAAGATYRQLVEKHGTSIPVIRGAVLRAGGKSRSPSAAHSSPLAAGDPAAREEALRLYREGWSVRKLAGHFHANGRVVSTLLSEAGVDLHPGGRMHPRFRTDEECRAVADRYNHGASLAALATEFGCSTPTIKNAVVRGGGEVRDPGMPKVWTQEVIAWAAKEYQAGRAQQSIADELGVHQTGVSSYLRAAGVLPAVQRPAGANHGSWRGGRVLDQSGYVRVLASEDDACYVTLLSGGYVLEHRLVMGRALGRKLTRHETVHHINGDRTDNRLENLQLRQGRHGKGVVIRCNACGSHDVSAVEIAD